MKVTKGVVSSLAGIKNDYSQIQIDAALQPGNSGGPAIRDGKIAGMNYLLIHESGQRRLTSTVTKALGGD